MLDDPLGLIVQGIAVLAAGMYPVGFLFGVCSDCCPCQQPCNLCQHYCDLDTLYTLRFDIEVAGYQMDESDFAFGYCEDSDPPDPPPPGWILLGNGAYAIKNSKQEDCAPPFIWYNAGFEGTPGLSLLIGENGVETAEFINGGLPLGEGTPLDIDWPECFPNEALLGIGIDIQCNTDGCGCPALPTVNFRAQVMGNDQFGSGLARGIVSATVPPDCAGGSLTPASLELAFTEIEFNNPLDEYLSCDDENLAELLGNWLTENLPISITNIEIDSCECGPCCHGITINSTPAAACTENVSQRRCETNTLGADSTWLGVNATCDECPIGSCCDAETQDCLQTFEDQCDGTWTLGESCEPNPCPAPPTGACCDANGNCTQTTDANCQGTWTEGVECEPNPCPPPTGACCDNEGNCTQTTQANCPGTWSQGVACDPDPCNNDNGWCCMYQNGLYLVGYAATQAECAYDGANSGPDISTTWTPGGEIECPETP